MTRFEYLLKGYTEDRLTAGELQEFLELVEQFEPQVKEKILEDLDTKNFAGETSQEQRERMYKVVQRKIQDDIPALPVLRSMPVWKKLIAAASIILVVGISSYFLFFDNKMNGDEIVKTVPPATDVKAPETNRAMITLADGKTVYLDSALNGQLAMQGNVKLVKLANGQIAYETANGELIKEIQYNTLQNPRGSKVIDMQLSDGSRVWLNAGSSVTYPVAFVGDERKVNISGEAYFEIAHDASKPFIVTKGDLEVAVLGTHFNVNAYDDEEQIKVTLLEGSVKVSTTQQLNKSTILKPGQQAQVANTIKVINDVDTESVMAWKNGKFYFNRDDIRSVMRQLARWYDLEVVYQGEVTTDKFGGDIQRDLPLSETLNFLKDSKVNFEIQGRKVIVKK